MFIIGWVSCSHFLNFEVVVVNLQLLNSCRETDPATRILFGECLGEIGAIDPGRLVEMLLCKNWDLLLALLNLTMNMSVVSLEFF